MNFIHKTAIVETRQIGDGNYIGPYTYISNRVRIGDGCWISGASIGLPGEHPNLPKHEDKGGMVVIGNNCEIREYVTINTPFFGKWTTLEDGCYLMAKSHVGHDVYLKERVVLHTGAIIGGHSTIGRYCYMGLNCSTHPFAELGDYCIVGANNMYKGKSPGAIVWAGVPAKPIKVNTVGLDRHAKKEERYNLIYEAEKFISEYK